MFLFLAKLYPGQDVPIYQLSCPAPGSCPQQHSSTGDHFCPHFGQHNRKKTKLPTRPAKPSLSGSSLLLLSLPGMTILSFLLPCCLQPWQMLFPCLECSFLPSPHLTLQISAMHPFFRNMASKHHGQGSATWKSSWSMMPFPILVTEPRYRGFGLFDKCLSLCISSMRASTTSVSDHQVIF